MGIVSSKRLWFSDIRASNDPREIIFAIGKIRRIASQVLEEKKEPWDIALLQNELDRAFQTIRNTSYFCCCFSPRGDQFPMWRTYANSGDGIAIGFRPRALYDLHGRFNKVDYFPDTGASEDLKLSEIIGEILKRAANYRVAMTVEQGMAFAVEIISRSTSIKHDSWEHEREVRCVYSQTDQSMLPGNMFLPTSLTANGSDVGPFEVKYRQSAERRISYLEFYFGKSAGSKFDPSGAIARVVVGPKSSLGVPQVKAILNSEGFVNFEVVESECSWR